MRVLAFGTYDASMHPRVATIAEGLRAHGVEVPECNAPLGLDTAARVAMLTQPWRAVGLLVRIIRRWLTLARSARRMPRPDAVLVGYLGHFDVHLARLIFRGVPVLLDQLIGASDTARDRRVAGRARQALLTMVDSAALRAAHVVLVDTQEHLAALPDRYRARGLVVPVGAPAAWFAAQREDAPVAAQREDAPVAAQREDAPVAAQRHDAPVAERRDDAPVAEPAGSAPLRVVFFGLYTPLQGAPVIGAALGRIAGAPIEVTMVGTGQDGASTRAAAAGNPDVRWLDWVPAAELPALVAAHDVCLGIFGAGEKALRVVPNKVYQGAAAGCAIVTSDTAPQRRALGTAAVLVPPDDPAAIAGALVRLAGDRAELARMRGLATRLARESFAPGRIAAPVLERLRQLLDDPTGGTRQAGAAVVAAGPGGRTPGGRTR